MAMQMAQRKQEPPSKSMGKAGQHLGHPSSNLPGPTVTEIQPCSPGAHFRWFPGLPSFCAAKNASPFRLVTSLPPIHTDLFSATFLTPSRHISSSLLDTYLSGDSASVLKVEGSCRPKWVIPCGVQSPHDELRGAHHAELSSEYFGEGSCIPLHSTIKSELCS